MLASNHLIGFGASSGAVATWQTVASNTLTADNTGWSGYTIRQFIPQASLLVTGGTKVRVTVVASAAGAGIVVDFAYIGQADAAYNVTSPAFATTPTQLLFNAGSAGVTLTAGQSIVSDEITFATPTSQGLIISMHFSSTSTIRVSAANTPANWKLSYKNASDASTVAASSYIDFTATLGGSSFSLVETYA